MKKVIYSAVLMLSLSLAACSDQESYSPQEILDQAMQETSELSSYYAEYKTIMEDDETIEIKQWAKNGKVRVETIDANGEETLAINDGKILTSYTKSTNTAIIYDFGEEGEGLSQLSVKEQALRTLEIIKDSHDITVGEDEKIAGHDTYHLIAKAKKSGSLIGDMEIWVDKKTWMTLKSVSKSGDLEITSEFMKFEPNAKIDDEKFVANLPKDAIIQHETVEPNEQITIDQAKERLGEFLVMPEKDGLKLESIEDLNVEKTGEIALTYSHNGNPAFTLSVFKPIEVIDSTSEEEEIEVRGIKGSKMDIENFRILQWHENGLSYNIIFENPDLTFDEVLKLTEQMEIVK